MKAKLTPLVAVSVCAACKRASCWQNVFPCEALETTRRRIDLPRETLVFLDREMPEYWSQEWAEAARIYKGMATK